MPSTSATRADGQIVDNVFWGVMGYTIQFYPNAQRMRVAHNVIDGGSPSLRGGIVFGSDGGSTSNNNVVEFNIITYAATYNVTTAWDGSVGSGNIARSNCLFGGGSGNVNSGSGFTSQNNLTADPLFVNRAAHDYRLKAGSPCLGLVGYDMASRLDLTSSATRTEGAREPLRQRARRRRGSPRGSAVPAPAWC